METKYGVSISETTFPSQHVAYVLQTNEDFTFEERAFTQYV